MLSIQLSDKRKACFVNEGYGRSAGKDNSTGSGVRQVPGGRRAPAGAGAPVSYTHLDVYKRQALWFLREHDQYATAILQTRYSIALTEARKNIIELLICQFAGILLDNDSFAMTTILNGLWSVVKAGTHIQDNECCAYYQALKWKAIQPTQEYFTIDDILPNEPDRVCVHLDLSLIHICGSSPSSTPAIPDQRQLLFL